jgi:uncharacterized protein (DUF2141 family)
LTLVAATLALAGLPLAEAKAAELRLNFPSLRPGGQVSIAVFAADEGWRERAPAIYAESHPALGDQLTLRLQLPPGDYGVMAYHDRNANGRLDRIPLGPPTEPYGFSNNARALFGPPDWSAARFRLPSAGTAQTIRLR